MGASSVEPRRRCFWQKGWRTYWPTGWRVSARAWMSSSNRRMDRRAYHRHRGASFNCRGSEKVAAHFNASVLKKLVEYKLVDPLQVRYDAASAKDFFVQCGRKRHGWHYPAGKIGLVALEEHLLHHALWEICGLSNVPSGRMSVADVADHSSCKLYYE